MSIRSEQKSKTSSSERGSSQIILKLETINMDWLINYLIALSPAKINMEWPKLLTPLLTVSCR